MTKRYEVAVTLEDGSTGILSHRDRIQWCRSEAYRHAKEFTRRHGLATKVREA